MECFYPVYVQTYRALRGALERDDARELRTLCLAVSRLSGPEAIAATSAQADALSRVPMRSKVHVCRLRLGPPCTRECRESALARSASTRA